MSYTYTPLTSDNPVLFIPPSLVELGKKAPEFRLAPPTPLHEDKLNAHLAVLGVTRITESDVRALMVHECFNIWPEEEAEANANFLDSVWERQTVYQALLNDWLENERERRLDIATGAPEDKVGINAIPESLVSARDKAKHTMLVREIQRASQKVRIMAVEKNDFGTTGNDLMVKMHLLPEANNFTFEHGRDSQGLLCQEDVDRVKNLIGLADFDALIAKIDSLYSFSKEEEGNSVSLLEKPSAQNSSTEPSDGSATSDGNSTGSSTTPAPPEE